MSKKCTLKVHKLTLKYTKRLQTYINRYKLTLMSIHEQESTIKNPLIN